MSKKKDWMGIVRARLALIPNATIGGWTVRRKMPSKEEVDFYNLRCAIAYGQAGREITHREVTILRSDSTDPMMSDTDAELRDLQPLYTELCGKGDGLGAVLINGLGLGCAVILALEFGAEEVTVIEIEPAVILLTGTHLCKHYGPRLAIHCADAFKWQPPKGKRYSLVWHDIWPDACGDHYLAMSRLHRRYGTRCDWQESWQRDWIREVYHEDR